VQQKREDLLLHRTAEPTYHRVGFIAFELGVKADYLSFIDYIITQSCLFVKLFLKIF
jgi:hypothetical protein